MKQLDYSSSWKEITAHFNNIVVIVYCDHSHVKPNSIFNDAKQIWWCIEEHYSATLRSFVIIWSE